MRPLVYIGRISYGVYLYHWPVYLWLDQSRTGLDGWPLLALRLAVTFTLAILSYHLIERPIMRGRTSGCAVGRGSCSSRARSCSSWCCAS